MSHQSATTSFYHWRLYASTVNQGYETMLTHDIERMKSSSTVIPCRDSLLSDCGILFSKLQVVTTDDVILHLQGFVCALAAIH